MSPRPGVHSRGMRPRPPRDPFDAPSRTVVAEPVRPDEEPLRPPAVPAPVAAERGPSGPERDEPPPGRP